MDMFACGLNSKNFPENYKFDFLVKKFELTETQNDAENILELSHIDLNATYDELKQILNFKALYAQHFSYPAILINCPENAPISMIQILNQIIYDDLFNVQIVLRFTSTESSFNYLSNEAWKRWTKIISLLKNSIVGTSSVGTTSNNIHSQKIQLALDLNFFTSNCENANCAGDGIVVHNPSLNHTSDPFDKWLCEPIKYIVVSSDCFVLNKKGYPIFPKILQHTFQRLCRICPYYIFQVVETNDGTPIPFSKALNVYYEYLEHLWKAYHTQNPYNEITSGYEDVLQYPLQPLKDNLDAHTYATFEKDGPKYAQYEEALYYALLDSGCNQNEPNSQIINVMIVGAGRGPLITATLNAAARSQRSVYVIGVEKNPYSFLSLQEKLKNDVLWSKNYVSLVIGDIRNLNGCLFYHSDALVQDAHEMLQSLEKKPYPDILSQYLMQSSNDYKQQLLPNTFCFTSQKQPEKNKMKNVNYASLQMTITFEANIIASELLGSFGDNELSPECLEGALPYLKENGICIPQSYTSYLAPIMSPKLHDEVAYMDRVNITKDNTFYSHYEMAFVVHMVKVMLISPPQKVFTFTHLNRQELSTQSNVHHEINDNNNGNVENAINHALEINVLSQKNEDFTYSTLYQECKFEKANTECICHGFAGFFDCILYKTVKLSIVPETHTPDMFSWFPIYFPIKDPQTIRHGDEIGLSIWRCRNKYAVWYEWCLTEPYASYIHNVQGRSYSISL